MNFPAVFAILGMVLLVIALLIPSPYYQPGFDYELEARRDRLLSRLLMAGVGAFAVAVAIHFITQ